MITSRRRVIGIAVLATVAQIFLSFPARAAEPAAAAIDAPAAPAASPSVDQAEASPAPDANAVTEPPAGHSLHGEALSDGPRQHAYRMGGTGNVHFAITTTVPTAQQFFDQGVGQLHGFWYYEAERSFRQVLQLDPQCAMAYWGLAMANREDLPRATKLIQESLRRRAQASRRETLWIEGLARRLGVDPGAPLPSPQENARAASFDKPSPAAGDSKPKDEAAESRRKRDPDPKHRRWIEDLERIIADYPDDVEARAFLVWAIWDAAERGNMPISSPEATDALIREVERMSANHPGAQHYRIHLWDRPRAERAIASAAACGQSAPNIAHMWHMSGHIYSKLERFADAVWQQEAAARVDHAYQLRDHVPPYLIHNYAHNQEWMCRNLCNLGRPRAAIAAARNLAAIGRHPTRNAIDKDASCAAYGRKRWIEAAETYELWNELLELASSASWQPTDDVSAEVERLRLVGIAHFGLSNTSGLTQITAELEQHKRRAKPEATIATSTDNKTDVATAATEGAASDAQTPSDPTPVADATTDGVAPAAGVGESSEKPAAPAAEAPAPTEPIPPAAAANESVQPAAVAPTVAVIVPPDAANAKVTATSSSNTDSNTSAAETKPADDAAKRKQIDAIDQALGETRALLAIAEGRSEEAREQLKNSKGIPAARLARWLLKAGEPAEAEKQARRAFDSAQNRVDTQTLFVEALFAADKKEEAAEQLDELATSAAWAEEDLPVLVRLQPIAKALGRPRNWREAPATTADVGQRPELETLGPLTCQFPAAADWDLPLGYGGRTKRADWQGKPVIVIFYLGAGCLHCVEQLQAFAPLAATFERAGIGLLAISSENSEDFSRSLKQFASSDGRPFAIPLASDPANETFRASAAFDEFEGRALHGTILIDREGRIRWQDIGYEPFLDANFLVGEASRLLAVPQAVSTTEAAR